MIASGFDIETSALLSNHAAGIVVGKKGTAVTTQKEMIQFQMRKEKLFSEQEILNKISEIRNSKVIGFTNGCFDLLHKGHLHLIRTLKSYVNLKFH